MKLSGEFRERIVDTKKKETVQRTGCLIDKIADVSINETTFTPIPTMLGEYGLV